MAKILLATAHESVRNHYVDVLALDGHSFVMCQNGEAVDRALLEGLPDLIITDVDLPGLDAFGLVETLQVVSKGQSIPPLVIRSNKEGEDQFVWMGETEGPEDLRALVRARLAAAECSGKHGRVLVVDDDWNLRKTLQVRLEKEGYEVITALDGLEGLERMGEMPDVVLTDIDMPRLDGLGLVQRIRANQDYADVPVIMMTAHATAAEEAAEGLDLGANDYVRKPFEWRELTARVHAQIRIREAARLSTEKQRDLAIIELAGAAAHEINNPLAVIMARVELMIAEAKEGSELHEGLEQVDHLIHRIADVVKKMSKVRKYQVQNYCAGVNILDLNASAGDDA